MKRIEAYVLAIENEIKSTNLYNALKKSFKDESLKKTFHTLGAYEDIHREKLVSAFRREFPKEKLIYDKNVMPKINIKRDLSDPRHIFEYAIDREIAMADQYEDMAEDCTDEDIRAFFLALVAEEKQHQEMLEMELNRLHGTAIWFDSSELDGFMAF
jgi:rubrerythrin